MEPKPYWLNKSAMVASLGISAQAFDKWKVEPVARIGRENFYDVRSVLDNRLALAEQKREASEQSDEIDPLIEYRLMQERLRLTAAQSEAQELKNEVTKKRLIPADFISFAFAKFIPAAGSIFDTVVMTLRRRHPDLTPGELDSIGRELTKARNTIAQAADRLPEWHDEFIAESDRGL